MVVLKYSHTTQAWKKKHEKEQTLQLQCKHQQSLTEEQLEQALPAWSFKLRTQLQKQAALDSEECKA